MYFKDIKFSFLNVKNFSISLKKTRVFGGQEKKFSEEKF